MNFQYFNFLMNLAQQQNPIGGLGQQSIVAGSAARNRVISTNPGKHYIPPQIRFEGLEFKPHILTDKLNELSEKTRPMGRNESRTLLKELMKFPKELNDLIKMLLEQQPVITEGKKVNPKVKEGLLGEDIEIDLIELKNLLAKNGQQALNRLLQILQANIAMSNNNRQANELIKVIQGMIATTGDVAITSEMITQLLVMYVPWIPIPFNQNIHVVFQSNAVDEDLKDKYGEDVESVVIYITTNNLGTFKITLIKEPNHSIFMRIDNDLGIKGIMKNLCRLIKYDLKDVPCTIDSKNVKRVSHEFTTKKDVSIHPTGKMSPIILNSAYSVVKTILYADEHYDELLSQPED